MTTIIESFLACMRDLPNDIHRIIALIGVLDNKTERFRHDIMGKYEEVMKMATENKKPASEYVEKMTSLRDKQTLTHSLNEDKILLADQATYYISCFVRRLNDDIKKCELELEAQGPAEPPKPVSPSTRAPRRRASSMVEDAESYGGRSHHKRRRVDVPEPEEVIEQHHGGNKDEGSFCTCNGRVRSEQWIGCENPDCSIAWYHLECVGLVDVPEGAWFCSKRCRAAMMDDY
mmetsp:Transcript_28899/g.54121  ORF Transcript_28899/g.54121 Transcript_28899/m.54121 type:complete len:232 (-) Transcript_28899:162-857(-)